jgi:hypothetical protein
LPEGVVPVGCPSIVRLKSFDDRHGIVRNIGNQPPKSFLILGGPIRVNGKHDIAGRAGISEEGQLPRQLIQARSQTVDNVREAQIDIRVDISEVTTAYMALVRRIVFLGDGIWMGPAISNNERVELRDVFLRPTNLRLQVP